MNLQISIPKKRPCENRCPFCIVKTHAQFNIDALNVSEWQDELFDYLSFNKDLFDRVVITGENEPLQQVEYVIAALKTARAHGMTTEFITTGSNFLEAAGQTDFYNHIALIDVLSLSMLGSEDLDFLFISNNAAFDRDQVMKLYKRLNPLGTIRFTILETRMFTTKHLDYLLNTYPEVEITLKTLQGAASNAWIYDHSGNYVSNELTTIKDIPAKKRGAFTVALYKGREIWIDWSCQSSEGRYYIFRGDGKVYSNWEEQPHE